MRLNSRISIRKATAEDLPSMLGLVKELAEFEKAADQVSVQLSDYERDFAAGWFEGLVAEAEQGEIIGMMIFYPSYSTWTGRMLYLEDFAVRENARSQGIGLQLWEALVREAKHRKCISIKWQVLDWNVDAKRFYLKQQAEISTEWETGRLWLPKEG